jgi:rare lipoprotein A
VPAWNECVSRILAFWILVFASAVVLSSGCAARHAPTVARGSPLVEQINEAGGLERPRRQPLRTTVGLASYYGRAFHGRKTASGETFDMHKPMAAHPTFPFGTQVRVTSLQTGRHVEVTIVDRGPAPRRQRAGVIIDVSRSVAERLGFVEDGLRRVRVEVLSWGEGPSAGHDAAIHLVRSRPELHQLSASTTMPTTSRLVSRT